MGILQDRVMIVTGGATLIGGGVVRELVAEGATVVVADIDEAGLAALPATIGSHLTGSGQLGTGQLGSGQLGAGQIDTRLADITDDAQITALIDAVLTAHGRLDSIVNLAASYVDDGAATSRADWHRGLDVNLVSAVRMVEIARPHLAAGGHGSVVNFTSISSKVAQTGRWVYPASKAAMVQVTRSMALDLQGEGIRVNSVSPGWTWSKIMDDLSGGDLAKTDRVAAPFHILGRVGRPDEVGRVVAFLASDAASGVTGADWAVDGGYSALGPEQQNPTIPLLAAE